MKKIIAIIIWVISTILAVAIGEVIKDLQWFNKLTGIMKILFENFWIIIVLMLTILLVYLLIKWEIQKQFDKIKEKIIAQKKFSDFILIDISDHINKEIKKLELRCINLEKKADIYKEHVLTENDKLGNKRELSIKTEKINEYNDAFKDWGVGDFGINTLQTLYKTHSEFHDVK